MLSRGDTGMARLKVERRILIFPGTFLLCAFNICLSSWDTMSGFNLHLRWQSHQPIWPWFLPAFINSNFIITCSGVTLSSPCTSLLSLGKWISVSASAHYPTVWALRRSTHLYMSTVHLSRHCQPPPKALTFRSSLAADETKGSFLASMILCVCVCVCVRTHEQYLSDNFYFIYDLSFYILFKSTFTFLISFHEFSSNIAHIPFGRNNK